MNDEAKRIVVAEAARIAESYGNNIVIIIGWSRVHNEINAVSCGSDEQTALKAEEWLLRCSKLLGGDLSSAVFYERTLSPVERELHAKLHYLSQKMGVLARCLNPYVADFAIRTLADLPDVGVAG